MSYLYVCDNIFVCTDIINDWELYSIQQEVDPELVRQRTEEAQEMVTWMRRLDLSPQEPIATNESTEAHDCEEIKTFISNSSNILPQITVFNILN